MVHFEYVFWLCILVHLLCLSWQTIVVSHHGPAINVWHLNNCNQKLSLIFTTSKLSCVDVVERKNCKKGWNGCKECYWIWSFAELSNIYVLVDIRQWYGWVHPVTGRLTLTYKINGVPLSDWRSCSEIKASSGSHLLKMKLIHRYEIITQEAWANTWGHIS